MGDKTVSKELTDKMRDKLAAGFAKGDRIAALEEMVEACKADAQEAEAYAAELEAKLADLERWRYAAFIAHSNLDLDIEADPQALAALKGQDDE